MTDTLLQVRDLKTWFDTPRGTVRAVDGVSFDIKCGETFALLGESGCGKSMTALSLIQLVPTPSGRIAGGSVKLEGEELLDYSEVQMRQVRGSRIAMIFQEPQTSLGKLVNDGALKLDSASAPWMLLIPATLLATILLCFNFLGDGLRDLFDARESR